jgi:hypothetical protein
MNTPEIRGRVHRSDRLLAGLEAHLRLGFSVVVLFEDPVFTVTGVADRTAGVREGAGVDLSLAIRQFLEKAGGDG